MNWIRTQTACALLVFPAMVFAAQNRPSKAADFVAQQQAEEGYQRLRTTVEELQETIILLQKRIETLESQLNKTNKQLADYQANAATNEKLATLGKKFTAELEKFDARRIDDNKKIEDGLEELKKMMSRPLVEPPPLSNQDLEPQAYSGTVFTVKVEPGYTISAIARECRRNGYTHVTDESILQANPGLDPKKLQIGQIIYIPAEEYAP